MKRFSILLPIAILTLFLFPISGVQAQSASDVTWSSTITYFTTSDDPGWIKVIYSDNTTQYKSSQLEIGAKSSGDINIGSTVLEENFKGSAVLSSNVPVFSVSTQYAKDNPSNYSKAFYTGFSMEDSGSEFYLATVRANGITETTIGVQNVESDDIEATMLFYDRYTMQLSFTYKVVLGPNEAFISKLPDVPNYPGGIWDGSLVIRGEKVSDQTPGKVVASAVETQDNGRGIYSYQGTKGGASTIYIPSAMCGYFNQTSYYAIQNIGTETANVVVDFYDLNAVKVGSIPQINIYSGAKFSTNPCDHEILVGQKGSAVVRSTNDVPLIAMGKIHSPDGLITAFNGLTSGSTNLAAPYIRWSQNTSSNYNTYIAIMNLSDVNATNVVAKYYNAS
ncbi:MAG: hypothetical protein SVR94_11185, partial [Pseudomonadota bacterium]|nr:hypothetical protein [Pseudomonadota bacterium]